VDLKFPHHEAEIALEESISKKKPLAKYWLHTGFLTINGEKMSKSLENFITIRSFLETHETPTLPFDATTLLRYIVLSQHYRTRMDFTETLITQARQALLTLFDFEKRLTMYATRTLKLKPGEDRKTKKLNNKYILQFHKALQNDFNTPQALATVFEIIHAINTKMDKQKATLSDIVNMRTLLALLYELFGFRFRTVQIPKEVKNIVTEREEARRTKNWQHADELRNKAKSLGFSIEDTQKGPIIHSLYH